MRIFGWFLFLVIAVILTSQPIVAAKVTTETQAISLAKIFAQHLGWQVTDNLSLKVYPPGLHTGNSWTLIFTSKDDKNPTKYSFSVEATTGEVSGTDDSALGMAMEQPVKDVAFDEAGALTHAVAYLEKVGASQTDLQLVRNEPWRDLNTKNVINWQIVYRRTYKGILFEADGATIILNPRDGSLISLSHNNSSPLPKITEPRMTKDTVSALADQYLFAQQKVHAEVIEEPQLLIANAPQQNYQANGVILMLAHSCSLAE